MRPVHRQQALPALRGSSLSKPFTFKSPLPPADLFFSSMVHTAQLSTLEEMQLQLLSKKPDLSPDDLLGQKVQVDIELRDGAKRHISGYVTRFGIGVHQGKYFGYQAVVRPFNFGNSYYLIMIKQMNGHRIRAEFQDAKPHHTPPNPSNET